MGGSCETRSTASPRCWARRVCSRLYSSAVHAADAQTSEAEAQTSGQPPATRSPWLLLPTFSSNPKLGTSLGAMGAYVTKFDPESQVSIFGLSAQYTDTDSATVAAIARTSFGADHHRISMLAVGGRSRMTMTTTSVPGCRSSRKTTSAPCWPDTCIGSKGTGSSADSLWSRTTTSSARRPSMTTSSTHSDSRDSNPVASGWLSCMIRAMSRTNRPRAGC